MSRHEVRIPVAVRKPGAKWKTSYVVVTVQARNEEHAVKLVTEELSFSIGDDHG